jgi:hypothetical protein
MKKSCVKLKLPKTKTLFSYGSSQRPDQKFPTDTDPTTVTTATITHTTYL